MLAPSHRSVGKLVLLAQNSLPGSLHSTVALPARIRILGANAAVLLTKWLPVMIEFEFCPKAMAPPSAPRRAFAKLSWKIQFV